MNKFPGPMSQFYFLEEIIDIFYWIIQCTVIQYLFGIYVLLFIICKTHDQMHKKEREEKMRERNEYLNKMENSMNELYGAVDYFEDRMKKHDGWRSYPNEYKYPREKVQ